MTPNGHTPTSGTRTGLDRLAPWILLLAVLAFYYPMWSRPWHAGSADQYRNADWMTALTHLEHPHFTLVRYGEIPLHTHLYSGGYPVLQNPVNFNFSALGLPLYVLGGIRGVKVNILLAMWAGAWGVFLIARRMLLFGSGPSLFAGLAFGVSGWAPSWLLVGNPAVFFLGFTPLIVYWTCTGGEDRRRLLAAGLLLGTILAASVAFLRIFLYLLFWFPLFWAASGVENGKRPSPERVWLAAVVLVALSGIMSITALPFWARVTLTLVALGLLVCWAPVRRLLVRCWPAVAAALVVVVIAVVVAGGRTYATIELLRHGQLGHAGANDTEYTEVISLPDVATFGDALLHHGPFRGIYDQEGWAAYLEYAYLGLTWPLVVCLLAGVVLGWRRLAPFLVVGVLLIAAWFGSSMPVDFYRVLLQWVPGVNNISEPYKYFNLFVLLSLVLTAAAAADWVWSRLHNRGARLAIAVAMAGVLAVPFVSNQACLWPAFDRPLASGTPEPNFYQVMGAPSRAVAETGLAAVRLVSRDSKFREQGRPAGLYVPLNMTRNIGTIDAYIDIWVAENAVPRYFVLPDNSRLPNPEYRGEAWFNEPNNHVIGYRITPNTITARVKTTSPTQLLINQNYDAYFQTNIGRVTENRGLLAVDLPRAGTYDVRLTYRPWPVLVPVLLSTILFVAGLVVLACWPHLARWRRVVG